MIIPLAAASVLAALIVFFARYSRYQYLRLPELTSDAGGTQSSDLTVIIPARNEEAVIARAVRSLAGTPVVVVDDHSTDRTFAAAAEAGATVVEAQALPAGWLGKPNACWTGARQASSNWLLFADADTWYEPGFASALLRYAESQQLLAASCFPRQVYGSTVERSVLPYAFGLYFCGVNAANVNNPLKREALANGQCFLVRRDAYEFSGGHRSVAGSIIEDVALARRLKQHRIKAHVVRAESLASVRMYESFPAMRRGFEKNTFRFLQANPATGALVVAASIAMTSWLPVALWLVAEENFAGALLLAAAPVVGWKPWYRSWRQALWAPLAIYLFQLIALSGMAKTLLGLTTDWKGRRVG